MRVLVAVGSDLMFNSSANLCHLAYVAGLLENGCEVDLLTVGSNVTKQKLGFRDSDLINVYGYEMESLYEKAGRLIRRDRTENTANVIQPKKENERNTEGIMHKVKRFAHSLYGPYEVYIAWKNKAIKYRNDKEYDLVISLSFPPVSHLLVYELIKKKHISCKRWIQLWEDPWSEDLVFRSLNDEKAISKAKAEEARLLSMPDKVLYVSPITLAHQKAIFTESAGHMEWLPVPTYYNNDKMTTEINGNVFGYFGDYSSKIRNLRPFYEAAKACGTKVNICGYSDNMYESTDNIMVRPRITLEELKPIEDKTNVLVFVSNLRGGQIPGKIYQYSATDKPILFILDGEEDEKAVLKEFFGKFNRYIFCENTAASISEAIQKIESGQADCTENKPLECFSPSNIVKQLLDDGGLKS